MHPSAPADTIQTINYGKTPEWDVEARRLTGGMGVDFVIEIGGQGTLAKSIRSTKPNGFVAISGKSLVLLHLRRRGRADGILPGERECVLTTMSLVPQDICQTTVTFLKQ